MDGLPDSVAQMFSHFWKPSCEAPTCSQTHAACAYCSVPESDVLLFSCSFPFSLRFYVQHCFLERSWCQRGCGCFWTLMAGRKLLGVSWEAHTSCQQRELSFSPPTESFSKASHMIHWVNQRVKEHVDLIIAYKGLIVDYFKGTLLVNSQQETKIKLKANGLWLACGQECLVQLSTVFSVMPCWLVFPAFVQWASRWWSEPSQCQRSPKRRRSASRISCSRTCRRACSSAPLRFR